jgi:molybdopterin converting factor small subunit
MATIQVLYFAALREHRGLDEEQLEVADGASLAEIYAQVFADSPVIDLPVAFAKNRSYARPADKVSDGDVVTFLPPLGGG